MNMQLAESTTINITPQNSSFANIQGFSLESILSTGITLLLVVAGIIFFVYLVLGGIKWITSGGDKASTEGARNQITAALIGLIVVFSAWAIVNLISSIFGVNLLDINIPSVVNTVG